ncbi:MAG: sulfurtransferase [Acidipila sp.]|nr:sulfurtransferase [Acidipila sp.]
MNETLQFVARHGYAILFVWVFSEQIGLPLPSMPILLAAGALAGDGRLDWRVVVGVAMAAALASDVIWYHIGRARGIKVLQLLCRISLEPDSCVRNTQEIFAKHGVRSLLVAKFIPGLNTAAPPLAGVVGMLFVRFLLFDAMGVLLWAGSITGVGFYFSDQLELVVVHAERLGAGLVVILALALGAFIAWKYTRRRGFMRELRLARITPEELSEKIKAGEDLVILDLRGSVSFEADPETIPGARHINPSEFDDRHHEIPRDREVILYCT